MYKQHGFGALINFQTLGLNRVNQAKTSFSQLSRKVDTGLNKMQQKMATFTGFTMLGGALTYAGSKLDGFVDKGLSEFEKIENSTVRLWGKLKDISKQKFNKIISEIVMIGEVTKFTVSEALDATDAIRALGTAPTDLVKSTKAVLNFATATEEIPKIAAKAMVSGKNAFKMTADQMDQIGDIMMAAKNKTAMASGDKGVLEFSDINKNMSKFSATIPIAMHEAYAFGGVLRGLGASSQLAGRWIGIFGEQFSRMEFSKAKQLAEYGLNIRGLDGKRKRLVDLFTELTQKYMKWQETLGHKEADQRIEDLFPTSRGSATFFAFLENLKKEGASANDVIMTLYKSIEDLSPQANKGAAKEFREKYEGTLKGLKEVTEGLKASIMASFGQGFGKIEIWKFDKIVKVLSRISAFFRKDDGMTKKISMVLMFGAVFLKLSGIILLAIGSIGLLTTMTGGLGTMFMMGLKVTSLLAVKFLFFTAVVAGLAYAGYNLYKHWDKVKEFFEQHKVLILSLSTIIGAMLLPAMINTSVVLIKNTALFLAQKAVLLGYWLAIQGLTIAQGLATAAQWAFNAAVWSNPVTWLVVGVIALVGALIWVATHWDIVREKFLLFWNKTVEGMKLLKTRIISIFKSIFEPIKSIFNKFMDMIKGFFAKIINFVPDFLMNKLPFGEELNDWAVTHDLSVENPKGIKQPEIIKPSSLVDEEMQTNAHGMFGSQFNYTAKVDVHGDISEDQKVRLKKELTDDVSSQISDNLVVEQEKY